MPDHLENLANRLEGDPFFLGCPLALYARSEALDEKGLVAVLGCSVESLTRIRLCRAPAASSPEFHADLERVATRFNVPVDALIEVVRRGQAIWEMMKRAEPSKGTLLAARDLDEDDCDGGKP